MNTTRNEYEARIGTHFLSALINGDESGLNTEDKEQLTDWLEQFDGSVDVCLPSEDEDGNEIDPESFFGRCEICGLFADVMDVTVMVWPKAETVGE